MVKYSTDRQKCRSDCLEFVRQSAQPLCNGVVQDGWGWVREKKRTHRINYVFKCLHQVASLIRLLSPL